MIPSDLFLNATVRLKLPFDHYCGPWHCIDKCNTVMKSAVNVDAECILNDAPIFINHAN